MFYATRDRYTRKRTEDKRDRERFEGKRRGVYAAYLLQVTLYIHFPSSSRRRTRFLRDSERKFSILRCYRSSRWILDRSIGIIQFVLLFGCDIYRLPISPSFSLSFSLSRSCFLRSTTVSHTHSLGRSRPINFIKRPERTRID